MRAIDADQIDMFECCPVDWATGAIDPQEAQDIIDNAPTLEAEPVRYGHWRKINYGRIAECSCCSDLFDVTDSDSIEVVDQVFKNFCILYNYCPNCGARMRKEYEG